ncbi:MAG: Lrp/AsnC family transcriptional regulator, partial [Lentisphaeria bacterium]|nr:Lrp/AsnC family transcriptional regulator [Lentisphaeria bacterium]
MKKKQVLELLRQNARLANSEMALRLGISEAEVAAAIAELEESQVIQGYTVIVNEDVMSDRKVRAEIEVKVTPRRDGGFDTVARRIARFPEVVRMNLVSGSYDLLLEVEGD